MWMKWLGSNEKSALYFPSILFANPTAHNIIEQNVRFKKQNVNLCIDSCSPSAVIDFIAALKKTSDGFSYNFEISFGRFILFQTVFQLEYTDTKMWNKWPLYYGSLVPIVFLIRVLKSAVFGCSILIPFKTVLGFFLLLKIFF